MEIALWSEGAVSYEDLKRMPSQELNQVTKALNEYLKKKAKSFKGFMGG